MGTARFEDVCKLWMEEKSKTVKTTSLAAYSLIIDKHLAPRFKTLDDITPDSVRSIVRYDLDNHLKINTIKSILLVLKMIVKYSEEKGWMKHINLFSRMLPHGEMSDPQVLTVDEERAFINWLKEHPTKLNIGLLLCACCGLRIGEVCALRWEDIDLRRQVIQIRRTVYRVYNPRGEPRKRTRLIVGAPKTENSWRELPLADFLVAMLNNVKGKYKNHYLLSGDTSPTDPQNFRNNFKRVLTTLGFPTRKVHSLRHSFATRCLESDCDYKTLSSLLGHSNITTTLNIYAHPDINQKRKCVENMLKII